MRVKLTEACLSVCVYTLLVWLHPSGPVPMTTTTTTNSLLNPHQSGFTKRHSTKNLFTSMYNKLISAISHRQVSCLCLLDISAAFDIIDHNILRKRLSTLFGFTDTALTSRSFYVKTSEASSRSYPLTCGVPQGSVLGPLLCNLYTTPLSSIIKASSVDHHLYADDTQLFMSFSPSSFSESIDHLLHVVKQISSWMTSNLLCLNPSKPNLYSYVSEKN